MTIKCICLNHCLYLMVDSWFKLQHKKMRHMVALCYLGGEGMSVLFESFSYTSEQLIWDILYFMFFLSPCNYVFQEQIHICRLSLNNYFSYFHFLFNVFSLRSTIKICCQQYCKCINLLWQLQYVRNTS